MNLAECEIDLETNDLPEASRKDGIVSALEERNLLRYGSIISENDIEHVMGVEKLDCQADAWSFTVLQLREVIKGKGYYVSSRGRDNNLYILLQHEMPTYNEKKNKATFRNLKQRTRALHMIDQSLLSEEHQKKLEFEIFRNASFEIELSNSLKKRCR